METIDTKTITTAEDELKMELTFAGKEMNIDVWERLLTARC